MSGYWAHYQVIELKVSWWGLIIYKYIYLQVRQAQTKIHIFVKIAELFFRILNTNFHAKSWVCSSKNGRVRYETEHHIIIIFISIYTVRTNGWESLEFGQKLQTHITSLLSYIHVFHETSNVTLNKLSLCASAKHRLNIIKM